MARRDEPTAPSELEEEGIPDLEGPLDEKRATGDPQEGHPPPRDEPVGSEESDVTARGQREGESLEERLEREEPTALDGRPEEETTGQLVEPDEGTRGDREKDLVGEDTTDDPGGLSPEEQAVRRRDEP